jgi:hypothetical protein
MQYTKQSRNLKKQERIRASKVSGEPFGRVDGGRKISQRESRKRMELNLWHVSIEKGRVWGGEHGKCIACAGYRVSKRNPKINKQISTRQGTAQGKRMSA